LNKSTRCAVGMIRNTRNPDSLEHRYKGEHLLHTLFVLFERERVQLLLAVLLYVIKHSQQ
jgi:hypothetical protein